MEKLGKSYAVRRNSFTLIEVMIAMVIVSVALMGIYTTMTMARRFVVASRYHLEAERIAYDQARAMSQMNYEDLKKFASGEATPGLLVETLTPMCYVNELIPDGSISYSADISQLNGEVWTQVYNYANSCKIVVSVRSLRHTFQGENWVWESITQYRYDHETE